MRQGRFIALLVSFPFLFAIGGLATGAAIGTYMPEYYRSFFRPPYSEQMNPVAFGMGQGVTQGFVLGVVLSVIVGIAAALIGSLRGSRVNLQETLEDIRFQLNHLEQAILRLHDALPKQGPGRKPDSTQGIQPTGESPSPEPRGPFDFPGR
jgi:hypothetical protein